MRLKKAKTPLLASLQRVFTLAAQSRRAGTIPVDEAVSIHQENLYSRRKFLSDLGKTSLTLGMTSVLGTSLSSCEKIFIPPKEHGRPLDRSHQIAIVGAGIAGLNAAYQLQKQGIWADVYEGSSRTGGRMRTVRSKIVPGMYSDLGGEFVNSEHEDIIGLANEFGVPLLDTFADTLIRDAFFVDGERYPMADAIQDFIPIVPIIEADQAILEDYDSPAFEQLDNMSLEEYLQKLPTSTRMKKLLRGAYTAEFGLDASEQSPVYALYTIGTDTAAGVDLLASSDERYRLAGGSQELTDRMTHRLRRQIVYDHKLVAIRETGGKYTLVFDRGKEREAAIIIIAIPSSILKEIEFNLPDMSKEQKQAIQEMGFGTNAKLLLGFNQPIWRQAGLQGGISGDDPQTGWEHTQLQRGNSGAGYTLFQGGSAGVELSRNARSPHIAVDYYLPRLEKYFKQTGQYNGRSMIANWPDNPYTKGSYLCPKVGQMHLLELLAQPVGNVFFAGEHTSTDYQGYMNGGAESGRVAAEQVLDAIGITV